MKQSDSLPKQNETGSAGGNRSEQLERYFSALKSADHSQSFPETEKWLYRTNIEMENQKHERKLRKMKQYFIANKLRLAYPIIFLAILIGACSMPVTQTETMGNMLTWAISKDNTDAQNKINLLPWLKNANVTENENIDNGKAEILYTAVLTNTKQEQINSYKKDLESIGGISSLKITPMNYDVKRPLYSAALNNFFSIDINATGMNDQEVENEIQRKLKEQGVDMQVKVRTDDKGRRDLMIKMDPDKNNPGTPKSFEVNVDDKNGQEKIKLSQKTADPDKFKGKSDDEIRKIIREESGNPDLKDNEIQITRNGDKVSVKVQVERNNKR